ncbi:MAG: hypothetical protein KDI37_14200 [Xanthomonadales bacterium]|nr:hypothetical protein [Xanthomonadales bacterium]
MSAAPSTESAEPRVSYWLHWLRRPGLALPALYVLSSTIGMLFYWAYFRRFGIDILAYIDPTDLLLASFRRPTVWLILVLSILAVHLDNLSSARYGRRPHSRWTAWYGSATYRRANVLIGVAMIGGFLVLLAHVSGERVREGRGDRVQLTFAEDGSQTEGQLIGTSSRFIFVHEVATGRSMAYPFEALRSVETVVSATPEPVDNDAMP